MGIFSKLFGKREESIPEIPTDFDLDESGWGAPEIEQPQDFEKYQSTRSEEMEQFHVPAVPEVHQQRGIISGEGFRSNVSDKDVQLILSKLDLISSRLDNVSRRLENIEGKNRRDW